VQASCNCWRRRRKLRLKDRADRISADIKEKEEILNKKRETWPTKCVSDLEESIQQLEERKRKVDKLVKSQMCSKKSR
jgi:uncharacterized protein YoxC